MVLAGQTSSSSASPEDQGVAWIARRSSLAKLLVLIAGGGFLAVAALAASRVSTPGPPPLPQRLVVQALFVVCAAAGSAGGALLLRAWSRDEVTWRWGILGLWTLILSSFGFVLVLLLLALQPG